MKKRIRNTFFIHSIIISGSAIFLMVASCSRSKTWKVEGTIATENYKDAKEVYLYTVGEDFREDALVDSTAIKDGIFTFEGENKPNDFSEYSILLTRGGGINYHLLINNGDNITIKIDSDLGATKYSGSSVQDEYIDYMEIFKRQNQYTHRKSMEYQTLNFANRDSIRYFMIDYQTNVKKYMREKIDRIAKINSPNLSSFLVAREISYSSFPTKRLIKSFLEALSDEAKETKRGKEVEYTYNYYDSYNVSQYTTQLGYDGLLQKYDSLNQANKNSKFGKITLNQLKKLGSTKIGNIPPPIISKTIEGKPFDMKKDVKSKLVIVDFWASWCAPCRKENPSYVRFYKKYKNRGLEIVGYSLDTNREDWKKAILQDGLKWIQVSNLDRYDEVGASYNVKSIPTNFIIQDDKIVAVDLFGSELEDFLKEKL